MSNTIPFVVRFDRETYEALTKLAQDNDRSIAGHVRFLVKREINTVETMPADQRPIVAMPVSARDANDARS